MRNALILLMLFAAPAGAQAASIFLNGVNIDGVKSQIFENCKVEIDALGNIYITAKGYAAQRPGEAPATGTSAPATQAPVATGVLTKRYFLVTEKAAPGMAQYDVDLFINAKWVRKFLDSEEHVIMEVTKYLVPGQNKVSFVAKKDVANARRSASPQHYFRIVMGEGNSGGRNVMITKRAVDYKRTAFETKDYQDDFTVLAE